MPLRIGVDLDGVLADMDSELARQVEIVLGDAVARRVREGRDSGTAVVADKDSSSEAAAGEPPATGPAEAVPVPAKLDLSPRQQRRLWRHIASIEGFWETLEELEPGVVSRLAALAADRQWEIIFLTKRPQTAGLTSQVQSQRWLVAKGFALPSVYVVQGSRGLIAAALGLDIVIDDRPENCLDVVADSKARAILVWRDDEKNLPVAARRLGIGTVKSINDCLDILVEIDTPATDENPGVLDRVKRLLGFKEPASA